MATMDDIAKQLGITKGTVSKALSGATDVSESMRKSVLETAVELGYTRIPRTNQAPRIAIFIENMAYEHPEDFGWDLVVGFRKEAEPAGYAVDLIPLTDTMQHDSHYDEYMLRHNYLGALILGISYMDPWLNDFRNCRTPTVLFDNRVQQNPNTVHIGINCEEGMDLAVKELYKLGHRKIGYLSSSLGSYIYQERYLSFFRALRNNHLSDDRSLAGHAYSSAECAEIHLHRLLEQGCTAILCSHDILAHAILIHCSENGIRVPEDVSIIGIDDLPLCNFTTPRLSSIRQDRTELGKGAYYALSCQMNQIHIDTLTLHPEIIIRDSVGPVAPAPASDIEGFTDPS